MINNKIEIDSLPLAGIIKIPMRSMTKLYDSSMIFLKFMDVHHMNKNYLHLH